MTASVRCPSCGGQASVREELLAGFVKATCPKCGTWTGAAHVLDPVLPSRGLARRSDPETSRDAALSVDPRGQHRALLDALGRTGTGTRCELAAGAGLTEYQAGRRLSELEQAGRIEQTGELRPGESGRMQRVWRLASRDLRQASSSPRAGLPSAAARI